MIRHKRQGLRRRLVAFQILLFIAGGNLHAQDPDQVLDCARITAEVIAYRLYAQFYDRHTKSGFPGSAADFEAAAKAHVEGCAAGSAGGRACQDLNRSTKAIAEMYGTPSATFTLDKDFHLDPVSCEIVSSNGRPIDEDWVDSPTDPFYRAQAKSRYAEVARHQRSCRQLNENDSRAYGTWVREKKAWYARQKKEGAEAAIKPLEDYLERNCSDNNILLKVGDLLSDCRSAAQSDIKVELAPSSVSEITASSHFSGPSADLNNTGFSQSPKSFLLRMKDWGEGRIVSTDPEPFTLNAERPSRSCPIAGSCSACCTDEGVTTKAYLFGGPSQSIIVKQAPVALKCTANDPCGRSSGDPHICTHDGLKFDFQGVGEFILAKTANSEVQARQVAFGRFASITSVVAVKINGDHIGVYGGRPPKILVNGESRELEIGSSFVLPGGTLLRRDENAIRISNDEHAVEISAGSRINSVNVWVPPGSKTGGLLGDRNSSTKDDIRLSDGRILGRPLRHQDLYGLFGSAWRIRMDESLFVYEPGQSTETFTDRSFPVRRTSIKDLNAVLRSEAEVICRRAGVSGSNLEDCTYDVALTGDESFAEDAKGGRDSVEHLDIAEKPPIFRESADAVKVEVPLEAIASFPVEIRVSGPAAAHTLTFTAVGNPPSSRAPNPYSSIRLRGGEQVVTLHSPYLPGEYELRYVTFPGHKTVLLSIPFRSVAPSITIEAAEIGAARSSFDVYIAGDISPNMKLTIVPVGSRDNFVGTHAYIKGGLSEKITIRNLPREPGKYEIRVVSSTNETIYAKKALEIKIK